MFGDTRLIAVTRSPPTASVRLRRSVVVVTTAMRSCANAGGASASTANAAIRSPHERSDMRATKPPSPPSALGDPDALRHHAMDVLLGLGDRAHAAVHRHAGESVGIEPRDLLLRLEIGRAHV